MRSSLTGLIAVKGHRGLQTAPAIPERLHRLPELANDLWWTWNTAPREVFRRLDYPLWRQTAHNPVLMLRLISQRDARRRGRRSGVPGALRRGDRRARCGARRHATPGGSTAVRRHARADRLLLGRVRAAPVAADLRRRPRRAGRRSLQGSQRPRRAADRRRLHVSAGLLPPERLAGRLAEGGLRAPQLGRRADRAGADARRQAVRHRRAARQPHGARRRCGGSGSGACTLYLLDTDLEENAPWDRELSARLYGGDRETRIQQEIILGIGGVRALKALGHRAGRLAPQRRPRGVRRAAADPRPDRARRDVRVGARGSPADDDLHHPHAGAGRPRRVPVQPGRDPSRRRLGHARRDRATRSWRSATTTTAAGRCST